MSKIVFNLQESVRQDLDAIKLLVKDTYYKEYLVVLKDRKGNCCSVTNMSREEAHRMVDRTVVDKQQNTGEEQ